MYNHLIQYNIKSMKNIINTLTLCFFLILVVGCGNADEPEAGVQNNSNSGTADVSIDGESIELTSVSCKEQEYSYLIEATGTDGSLEIEFSPDRMNSTDDDYDFRRANYIELYIYGSESTEVYRGKTGSEPGFDVSGSESHAAGVVELARYNDADNVLTVEVDIRCEA